MGKEVSGISQSQLVEAWKKNLPIQLNQGDSVKVRGNSADPKSLRIHIDVAGHTKHSFDFECTYRDDRSVEVELVDVEEDNEAVDESREIIQNLVDDYVRHIHECAQAVQDITHH